MNGNGRTAGAGVLDREARDPRTDEQQETRRPPERPEPGEHEDKEGPEEPPFYKRPKVIIIAAIVLLILIVAGVLFWLYERQFESTDDAYVDGNIVQIAPRVSALVLARHINDNQLVHPGDLMIELDPTDFEVALEQARAQLAASEGRLAQAQAQIGASRASVEQSSAQIDAALVTLTNATLDLQRYESVDIRARSKQQLDNAIAAENSAKAQVEQARAAKISAEANVSTADAAIKAAEGDVKTAQANVHRAEVNLGYCRIYAPCEGRVTQRNVEVGDYMQTAQTMFMLVEPDVWVTANYKETQLKYMKPGQPVTLTVDELSGRKFNGRVDSIQAGSGSRFGVLPAENATGNFVKIVQRVPVKIIFDHGANTNDADLLSPGLSAYPRVKVR
jgi:membrane fusion protein (multidrug efflux system)